MGVRDRDGDRDRDRNRSPQPIGHLGTARHRADLSGPHTRRQIRYLRVEVEGEDEGGMYIYRECMYIYREGMYIYREGMYIVRVCI